MPSSYITRNLKASIARGPGDGRLPVPGSTKDSQSSLGRVTRVVLGKESCTEEEWNRYQRSQALYGVFYVDVVQGTDGDLSETGSEKFAYSPNPSLRQVPLKDEIVILRSNMAPDLTAQDGNLSQNKIYWVGILPTWNHPHLNALPNLRESDKVEEDGYFLDQGNDVNPLQLCPGDLTLEGRHGESLRFGGTWYEGSPIAVQDTNGKAYLILRAGQGTNNDGQGDKAIYEDINQDSGSFYITTAHYIPLEQSCYKRDAWKDKQLQEAQDYNKPQVMISSDRIWLNGRDDVELTGKNYVGLAASQVNVDGKQHVSLDAPKIYLGQGAQNEKEPVLKGKSSIDLISTLVDQFISLLDNIKTVDSDPGVFIGGLKTAASTLIPTLKTYQKQLPTLLSNKTYTE